MLKLRESTKKGYKEAHTHDGILLNRAYCTIAKGIVRPQHCGCLTIGGDWGTLTEDNTIRKLTPKEYERLQGFPDDWTKYGANGETISDTQRYKCLGNAVTTNVVTAILNSMFEEVQE
jgi:DNA (cytosine-5)-methyltransferase 1